MSGAHIGKNSLATVHQDDIKREQSEGSNLNITLLSPPIKIP